MLSHSAGVRPGNYFNTGLLLKSVVYGSPEGPVGTFFFLVIHFVSQIWIDFLLCLWLWSWWTHFISIFSRRMFFHVWKKNSGNDGEKMCFSLIILFNFYQDDLCNSFSVFQHAWKSKSKYIKSGELFCSVSHMEKITMPKNVSVSRMKMISLLITTSHS